MQKLRKVSESIPDDAVLVNIGTHLIGAGSYFVDWPINESYEKSYISKQINENVCIWKNGAFSLAYIRVKTIDFSTIDSAIDMWFEKVLHERNIHYGSTEILATGNSNFKSTIFPSFDEIIAAYNYNIDI